MRRVLVLILLLGGLFSGCTSFHAVETTPEGIIGSVQAGDTVRIVLRDGTRLDMMVWSITYEEIRGRSEGADSELVHVRFDRIETLSIERLSLRKTLLTTVVPAVLAAVLICERRDCDTRAVVVSRH